MIHFPVSCLLGVNQTLLYTIILRLANRKVKDNHRNFFKFCNMTLLTICVVVIYDAYEIVDSAPIDTGDSLGELFHVESRNFSTESDLLIIRNFYLNEAKLGIPSFNQS